MATSPGTPARSVSSWRPCGRPHHPNPRPLAGTPCGRPSPHGPGWASPRCSGTFSPGSVHLPGTRPWSTGSDALGTGRGDITRAGLPVHRAGTRVPHDGVTGVLSPLPRHQSYRMRPAPSGPSHLHASLSSTPSPGQGPHVGPQQASHRPNSFVVGQNLPWITHTCKGVALLSGNVTL